jgi:maltooligosyltrehalose trehalohydrolase
VPVGGALAAWLSGHELCWPPERFSELIRALQSTRGIALKTDDLRQRRLPIGAEIARGGGVEFRVWAPQHDRVDVVLEAAASRRSVGLTAEGAGYFSGVSGDARAGTRYRYRLDGTGEGFPDPASRFQPEGPHGPSEVVDPGAFSWTDGDWRGVAREGQVLYEMHVGTFTREGTWCAAARELPELARLGITVIEMMPVAEFAGRFGWGYDGVDPFAPTRLYGTPDDLRYFVNAAHAAGIGVILDVVYNHLGPDGCYLREFSRDYFTDRYDNEWGDAINFDGQAAGPVREYFISNARYWIDEFHFDGLRLDATQQIFDSSPTHVIAEITRGVRDAAGTRSTYVVAENEPQDVRLVRAPEEGGYGIDAVWNDDFHHSAMVAATGHSQAYYTDYRGAPQEFISAVKWGYLYQGQRYEWQKKRRGTSSLGLAPSTFVTFIQNHDQVANSASGERLHALTGPGKFRALTALLLLAPGTPMLFQGQEFAASTPFLFFADHKPELASAVRRGRAEFLTQFPSIATPDIQERLADPDARETFERCKLDFSERDRHAAAYALHCDLLRLRREDAVLRESRVDGAVLGPDAFVLRYFAHAGADRLLLVNLGRDLLLSVAPEPLLAPPEGCLWEIGWSSENPIYGGKGTGPVERGDGWHVPGNAAVLLTPTRIENDGGTRSQANEC